MDILTTQYKNFSMKKGEPTHEMHSRFTSITIELRRLGEPIRPSKQVQKILRDLPKSWERKVNIITEAIYLKVLIVDEFYELNKQ